MNALIRKESIEELCGHRARALELYQRTALCMKDAWGAHAEAVKVGTARYGSYPPLMINRDSYNLTPDEWLTKVRANLDRDMWKALINGTPLGSLMDRKERELFERSLEHDPPEATADNVRATMQRLMEEADDIFRRGLVNAFARFCRDYKSNDGFKIGERIVISWGVTYEKLWGFRSNYHREPEIHDLDRVMHVLDGKPSPEHRSPTSLVFHLGEKIRNWKEGHSTEFETVYWRCRIFKNGNIHLFPRDLDLLARANRLIAEHYGEVLPAPKGYTGNETSDTPPPNPNWAEDFFETPAELAADLVERAEVAGHHRCLEPSAGEGAIALALLKRSTNVDVIERNQSRFGKLEMIHGLNRVMSADFLLETPQPVYDRIVMNPPFSNAQDIRHVLHAVQFLAPGGRLVAVMSAGARVGSTALHQKLGRLVERHGGRFDALPDNSFKASGTSVRTVVLTIDKKEILR